MINGKKIKKFLPLKVFLIASVKFKPKILKGVFGSKIILIKKGILPRPIISRTAAIIKQK